MKGKRFRRAVEAEVEMQRLCQPIGFRNLTIDFEAKTVDIDGRIVQVEARCFVIPLLTTERAILSRGSVL